MRLFYLYCSLIVLLIGCKPKKVKPDVSYHYFEPWRLEYFSYQLGDTLSFTNEANSQVLHYACTKFDRYLETTGDTNECPSDMEFCSVHATEMIKMELTCLENSNYNFYIYNSASSSYFNFSMKGYKGGELLSAIIYKDSSCGLGSTIYPAGPIPDVECISGNINIGNKSYSKVAKFLDVPDWNQKLDTLYHNKSDGILRFSTTLTGDIWNKN